MMVARPAGGFPEAGLTFLGTLARHNSTGWFHDHKAEYDHAVKQPFVTLVERINVALAEFAPDYRVKLPKGLSRPNRDTRFSKDKAPYRTDISMVFPCKGLDKQVAAGFFLRIRSDGADIIGGAVVPGPRELALLRKAVVASRGFAGVTTAKSLTKLMGPIRGEQLRRVPLGFPADHQFEDLLRRKQFYFESAVPRSRVIGSELLADILARFRAMTPFVELLDGALGNRR